MYENDAIREILGAVIQVARRSTLSAFRRAQRRPRRRRLPVRAQEVEGGYSLSPTTANVRYGSLADINASAEKGPLSGVKRT